MSFVPLKIFNYPKNSTSSKGLTSQPALSSEIMGLIVRENHGIEPLRQQYAIQIQVIIDLCM